MAHACCVFLICTALLLPLASACLQCDKLIQYLLEDIALSAPLENQIRLNRVINGAYKIYEDISRQYQGVIDFTTLYRARTEFQSEITKYLASNPAREEQVFFAIRLLQQGETILKNHLELFVRTGLCPNTCGIFNQSVISCTSCGNELRPCLSPADQRSCGVLQLEAEEESQVVLNCFLPWHSLVVEQKEYHFSRSSDLSGEFTAFLVTPQSKVILNQLEMDEQAVYRCLLQDSSGTVLTEMHYNLTVKALPPTPTPHVPTIPTVPGEGPSSPLYRDLVRSAIAAVTALGLVGSLAIAISFGKALKRQQELVKRWRRREEIQMTEEPTRTE